MDVGEPNFRFTLDDPEKKSRAIRYPMSSELHVSSLDRLNSSPGVPQLLAQLSEDITSLPGSYSYSATNCIIQSQRALLYGYFNRVAMTEFQLFLRVPTVIFNVNDAFALKINPGGVGTPLVYTIVIPPGYYTTYLLAAAMQAAIRAATTNLTSPSAFTVTPPANQATSPVPTSGTLPTGFTFNTNTTDTIVFASPLNIPGLALSVQYNILKCYRLIGTNFLSFNGYPANIPTPVVVTSMPNFLPTDYIDIVSKALTNYKDNKDTNSTESAPVGVLGRIYLSDMPNSPQNGVNDGYIDNNVIGSGPVTFTKKWAIPNWSQWSPNSSINQLDFTLLDMYGAPLYWANNTKDAAASEWNMTIVASE